MVAVPHLHTVGVFAIMVVAVFLIHYEDHQNQSGSNCYIVGWGEWVSTCVRALAFDLMN